MDKLLTKIIQIFGWTFNSCDDCLNDTESDRYPFAFTKCFCECNKNNGLEYQIKECSYCGSSNIKNISQSYACDLGGDEKMLCCEGNCLDCKNPISIKHSVKHLID